MAAHQMQVASASPADLAADMENHRQSYAGFLKLLKNICIGSAAILVFLFFVLQSY